MTMQNLYVDDVAKAAVSKWIEAKANEQGWAAVRKEAETELASHYQKDFEQIVDGLNDTTSLTTSVAIGDDLKVTIGNELKIDQPEAVEFLRAHPSMLGVLLKAEYRPISSAVVISKLHTVDEIGMALAKVIEFKPKTPGFSQK
jgi:DNA-binding LytR/AlgR family response regulator